MARPLLPEELWSEIQPLLPPQPPPNPKGGRPWVPFKEALKGILLVLRTGMAWQDLPTELGFGSGSTCWRRLADWTELAVWPQLHEKLVRALGRAELLDRAVAVVDSASTRAVFGGRTPGRTPRIGEKWEASVI